ncbi:MAG: N-acetylmuramoyl-L-alanine amidase [Pseudomonadota bacterium]
MTRATSDGVAPDHELNTGDALRADSTHVDALVPAVNVEARRDGAAPNILLMHYTGFATGPQAIDWLARAESGVSCHYVVDVDGTTTQMVREADRAWHAGESNWQGVTDINSCSIGIEIQNPGHDRGYPEFPDAQMLAVLDLSRDIIDRHELRPERVLAHSDIAPHRTIDPGEKFNWRWLSERGVGVWVDPAPETGDGAADCVDPGAIGEAQRLLSAYGYHVPVSGSLCARTAIVLTAFQRHFRPTRIDGRLDVSTLETLRRLSAAVPRHSAGPS